MLKPLLTLLALSPMLLVPSARADEAPAAPKVSKFESVKGKAVAVKGKLEDGAPMEDLTWAANSSNACFPATQNEKFRGNHVLFVTQLPPRSVMMITVTPTDPKQDVSLYAYSVGAQGAPRLPPKLPSCVSCEADHKWDRPWKGKTQDHTRTVRLNAVGNPYTVVIGVTGPKAATAGEFTLTVDTK